MRNERGIERRRRRWKEDGEERERERERERRDHISRNGVQVGGY